MGAMTVAQIVRLLRCDDYPDDRMRAIFAGRECWETRDIFGHASLSVAERLWLLLRGGFLDDREKIEAACRIAEHVLPIFEAAVPGNSHPRRALEVARRARRGTASRDEQIEARSAVRRSVDAAHVPYCVLGAADAAAAAADPDADRALRHASSCARAAVGEDGDCDEVVRQLEVVRGICTAERMVGPGNRISPNGT